MKESHRKDVANHPGPEPCEGGREAQHDGGGAHAEDHPVAAAIERGRGVGDDLVERARARGAADLGDHAVRARERAEPPHRLPVQLRRSSVENARAREGNHDLPLHDRPRGALRKRGLWSDVRVVRSDRARFLPGATSRHH